MECWCKDARKPCSICEEREYFKKLTEENKVLVMAMQDLLEEQDPDPGVYMDLSARLDAAGIEWADYPLYNQ